MTLTDLALLLIFIGIIILKIYVIIYCLTETKKESQEDISHWYIPIIICILVIIILTIVVACYAHTYNQIKKRHMLLVNRQLIDNAREQFFYA